jgi:transposase
MSAPFVRQVGTPTLTAAPIDHLPIIAHYLRRLGLVKIINALVPVAMAVEPGLIVLGLILDTLSGRSPLYHLEKTFEDYDQSVLFGQVLAPGYFNDDNVGRVMDRIYEIGTQKLFSAVSVAAQQQFSISTKHVHFDTTSVNVYGDYPDTARESAPFEITYGYSKDKRPDLKQFVLSLLCVEGNIPIVGKLEDGNASDKKINHRVLSEISRHMNEHGVADDAFIYVADSAMVTEENLAQVGRFITRLPATYNECERAILDAVDTDQWTEVGELSVTPASKNRPNACYRVQEQTVTLYNQDYRAIVVHSSAHDRRREKRLQRELADSLKTLNSRTTELRKKHFFCRKDAEQAALEWAAQTAPYHQLNVEIVECPRYASGRPKKDTPRIPLAIEYELTATILEKEPAIARARQMIGCFVHGFLIK